MNKDICSEIEIAVLSDAELSEKQKKHIEECESCKALLCQAEKMKNDLAQLCLPNIAEGQIASEVMRKIEAREYLPATKGGIRFTRHFGTIAAAVIVLVAVAIIKNPVNEVNVANDNTVNLTGAKGADTAVIEENMILPVADSTEALQQDENDSGAILFSVEAPETARIGSSEKQTNEIQQNESYTYYTGALTENEYSDNELAFDNADALTAVKAKTQDSDSAPAEDSISDGTSVTPKVNTTNSAVQVTQEAQDTTQSKAPASHGNSGSSGGGNAGGGNAGGGNAGGGNAGGGGGGSSSSGLVPLFADCEFLDGEENFDYNISVANSVLEAMYPQYTFEKSILIEQGYTNTQFIYIMSNLNAKDFLILARSKNSIVVEK